MVENYDLVILGGGMGGYVAAIRARQLGLSVALVEADLLGGTCLHRGCIPTKALLKSASVYQTIKESLAYGIETNKYTLHFSNVQARKEKIVKQLYQGVQHLMRKNNVDLYHGYGRLLGSSIFSPLAGTISVEHSDGRDNTMLIGKNVIIATGSTPRSVDFLPFDGQYILSSNHALDLEALPEKVVIVGGGVIGVEWASMLADFDVEVYLVEAEKQILPNFDHEIIKALEQKLVRKGIKLLTNTQVTSHEIMAPKVKLNVKQNEKEQALVTDRVLVAIGRTARTENIGLENTSIERDQSGFIKVNQNYQTKESHIYAIGDVIGGQQLAHVAANEGKLAVEHIVGHTSLTTDQLIAPSCVYSSPEVAAIGLTEQEAKQQGYQVKIGKMSFTAIGKAIINGDDSGFVKIISDTKTKDLLGIHMIGNQVTELISEAGLAFILDATAAEMGMTVHPHPSLSEAIQEAALAIDHAKIHG